LLEKIRRERLATRTILVTGHQREAWLIQAIELGVEGYLLKPHIPELIVAVKAVLAGQRFFCPWAFEFVITDYLRLRTEMKTGGLLTQREIDVLKCRVQGKSVKETAARMDISPKTVEKHVANLAC
jgi:DNA-binding NarL/FixJ family response regulator